MNKTSLDRQITTLVEFLNTLDGIKTIGSCQGHDDGGKTGKWVYPYIKFKSTSNHSLGLLASIEYIYADLNILYNLSEIELNNIYQPNLNAIWTIEVVPNHDYSASHNVENDEYVFYVLKAHSDSFTKPSEEYPDFINILDWYKAQIKSSIKDN